MSALNKTFLYKNHRGETRLRRVNILSLDFQSFFTYGYQPGWFLHCWDLDKEEYRSFALVNIVLDKEEGRIDLTDFVWRENGASPIARMDL